MIIVMMIVIWWMTMATVKRKTKTSATGDDGIRSLAFGIAALEAGRSGRTVDVSA